MKLRAHMTLPIFAFAVLASFLFLESKPVFSAVISSGSWTQNVDADFNLGTNLDTAVSAGSVRLAQNSYSDTFTGTTIDSGKWIQDPTVTQNDTLTATTEAVAWANAGVSTAYSFTGDFDVQVDFLQRPSTGQIDLDVYTSDGAFIFFYLVGSRYQLYETTPVGCTDVRDNVGAISSGRMRVIRAGTIMRFYRWTGSAWDQVDYCSGVTTGPATFNIRVTPRETVATSVTGIFDNFIVNTPPAPYRASGTYTSTVRDVGAMANFSTVSWTSTAPASTTLTLDMRGCSDSTCSTNPAWQTGVGSGASGSASIPSAVDGNQYVQYRARMTTSDSAQTPTLDAITINYDFTANYNFSLAYTPSATEILAGGSVPIGQVAVNVQNPQDASLIDPTALTSNYPSNISFSPTASCTPSGGVCTRTVYASFASAATYTVTITGNNASPSGCDADSNGFRDVSCGGDNATTPFYPGGATRTTQFTLLVSEPMSFTLSLPSGNAEEVIKESASASYPAPRVQVPLRIDRSTGADEGIESITLSGAPAGVILVTAGVPIAPFGATVTTTLTFGAQSGLAAGNHTFTIVVTPALSGAANQRTISFTLQVRNPLDYSLSTNPSSVGVFQNNSTSVAVVATYMNAPFGGTENLTFSNFSSVSNPSAFSPVPASGSISISFLPGTCTVPPTQANCKTMTISTSSTLEPRTYVVTFSGTSSVTGTQRSGTLTLIVSGPYSFSLGYPAPPCASASSCAGTIEQSGIMQFQVDVTSTSLAGQTVSLSVSGLPPMPDGVTYSVATTPSPCAPTSGNPCTATITLTASGTAPIGTRQINVNASASSPCSPCNRSLTYDLTIAQGFDFDIALASSPPATVTRGGSSASVLVNVNLLSGTARDVSVSLTGLSGSGVTESYTGPSCFTSGSPSTARPNCQIQLVLTPPPEGVGTLGPYTVTLTGSYATLSRQEQFTFDLIDPFKFDLHLSDTQASMLQGWTAGTLIYGSWVSGGSGSEPITVQAFPSPSAPGLNIAYTPACDTGCITSLNPSSPPLAVCGGAPCELITDIQFSGSPPSGNYTITILATSGSIARTRTFLLTVGTTLDFTLTPSPDNERVGDPPDPPLPDATGAITMTAENTSPENQPGNNNITFTVGDTPSYRLPRGVTVCASDPSINPSSCTDEAGFSASCSLGPVARVVSPPSPGDTCSTTLWFNVDTTAVDGVYNIPIVGSNDGGLVERSTLFLLKIGPLDLTQYPSPNVLTDAHQRPQITEVGWTPPAPFVGDAITLVSTTTVYAVGQAGTLAATPASDANASFTWTSPSSGVSIPSLAQPSITYPASGRFDLSVTVRDQAGGCYTATAADASQSEACQCRFESLVGSGEGINVSKPRPFFREIKP